MTFEITQAAEQCGLSPNAILEFISFEWINPVDSQNLLFDYDDIARIMLIADLKDQMGVNNEGVPIILHLIDQLNHLHLELKVANL